MNTHVYYQFVSFSQGLFQSHEFLAHIPKFLHMPEKITQSEAIHSDTFSGTTSMQLCLYLVFLSQQSTHNSPTSTPINSEVEKH